VSMRDYVEKDFYKTLGVPKDASTEAIKKAYRKLARELHPDKNPGDAAAETRFKVVSEAYDVLSDEKKRREYDEARSLFGGGGLRMGGGGNSTFDVSDVFGGAGDRLGDLFGGLFTSNVGGAGRGARRGGRARGARGHDVETEATLDFAEAVSGVTVPLRLSSPGTCVTCFGTGAKLGTAPRQCPRCLGSGLITRNQGAFAFSEPCKDCRGTGKIVDEPCPDCGGSGATMQSRTITVRIPAGVSDGQRIRITGKGSPGEGGGPAGDLYVVVHVRGHDLFGRKGNDLTITVPISFPEAVLGSAVRVPTLDGAVTLKVPAGTAGGKTFRVRGKGVPRKDGAGDLLVTVEVAVPANLTAEAREALEKYAVAQPDDPRPHITARTKG
jgi:molecular chaperone DnaJ